MSKTILIVEKLINITVWLREQSPQLVAGLRSDADAEKLYDYWQANIHPSPRNADGDGDRSAEWRIAALGYDPMVPQ